MEGTGLYWYEILNCVFNAWISYTAIILNILTIHAIRKTSSLPKPLKTLLLSLAVSDLGVGLLAQPLNIASFVMELKENSENSPTLFIMHSAYLVAMNLFFLATFFGVTALSADRFLAIHLHLRYQEMVTHNRVIVVVISIWLLSTCLSLVALWTSLNIIYVIFGIVETFGFLASTFLNYKIFLTARHHAHQIQVLHGMQEAQDGQMTSANRLRKSAVATVYLYVVFLVCYLPDICILWIMATSSEPINFAIIQYFTVTLLLLNSSLNPLIYCWKMRHIRHAVKNILRNILTKHKRISLSTGT